MNRGKFIHDRIKQVDPNTVYTPKEASWYLGLSDQTIRRACKQKIIKASNTCISEQDYFIIEGKEIIKFYKARVREEI